MPTLKLLNRLHQLLRFAYMVAAASGHRLSADWLWRTMSEDQMKEIIANDRQEPGLPFSRLSRALLKREADAMSEAHEVAEQLEFDLDRNTPTRRVPADIELLKTIVKLTRGCFWYLELSSDLNSNALGQSRLTFHHCTLQEVMVADNAGALVFDSCELSKLKLASPNFDRLRSLQLRDCSVAGTVSLTGVGETPSLDFLLHSGEVLIEDTLAPTIAISAPTVHLRQCSVSGRVSARNVCLDDISTDRLRVDVLVGGDSGGEVTVRECHSPNLHLYVDEDLRSLCVERSSQCQIHLADCQVTENLALNSADLSKSSLRNVDLTSASVKLRASTLRGAVLQAVRWPEELWAQDDEATPSFLADGYRSLKLAYQGLGDAFAASKFYEKEMTQELRCIGGRGFFSGDGLMLWLRRTTSRFGQSWVRPFMLLVSLHLVVALCVQLDTAGFPSRQGLPECLRGTAQIYVRTILPTHRYPVSSLFGNSVLVVSRVVNAFLAFQIVAGFRRYRSP